MKMNLANGSLYAALSGVLVTAICAPAMAQSPAALAPAPPSGVYHVDPNHTEVLFGVSHMGFTTYYGAFSGASGTLVLNGEHPAGSRLDIHVPVASVLTASAVLNAELKGPKWLDATAFPEMVFRADKITQTGPDTAVVAGDLTLHGVTHPLSLQARFNKSGINPLDHMLTVGFAAKGRLKRSDYGVTTYVPLIGDEVELILSGAFERTPSVAPGVMPK